MSDINVELVKQITAGIRTISDPAPTPEQEIGDIIGRNIDEISSVAVAELRGMRDKIDDLIRAMLSMRDGLKDGVREQVELSRQAIELKRIAEDAIARLTASVETGLPVATRKAITGKPNGKGPG